MIINIIQGVKFVEKNQKKGAIVIFKNILTIKYLKIYLYMIK